MPFRILTMVATLLLAACAAPAPLLPDTPVIVFGEQHDQPDHQRQTAQALRQLAARGTLAAVVIEMAERGRSTTGLPRDAGTAQVREALGWRNWDWPVYEGVVMAAVRAGVPVLGGNLPRERMREVMGDTGRDALLDTSTREKLAVAVREGHCGMLPAAQEPGMVRIQIARDQAMAETVAAAIRPGQQVLLLTGAQHASRDRGVPLHLALRHGAPGVHVVIFGEPSIGLAADDLRAARVTPRPDPCEGLRERLSKPPAAS
ncbi:MAG: ChaN family lipoprotein [Piscinibacter sp.]